MSGETSQNVTKGEGYSVANLDGLGEGPGFRKVRKELGVTAFGVNAIVLPPAYETGSHYHDEQEDLYFVHSGEVELTPHRGLRDLRHLVGAPGARRQQVDDLLLDQRRVHVHHAQPHRAPVQPAALDRDVHAAIRGHLRQRGPQRAGLCPGDVQLYAGDRIAGQPGDAVDVGAARGDPVELALYVMGRRDAAHVEVDGPHAAVEQFSRWVDR